MPAAVEQKRERDNKLSAPPPHYSLPTTSGFQHGLGGGAGFAPQHDETIVDNSYPFVTNPEIQPYDAWVLAGGRLFRAHSHILSAHSAYLRASINSLGEARLLLPHIPSGGFSAVLTYMYTGRLSLAHAPVYEILITGHLLQMPSIIALCQALLATPSITPSVPSPSSVLPFATENLSSGGSIGEGILPPALNAWRNLARFVPAARVVAPMAQPTLIKPTPTRPLTVSLSKPRDEEETLGAMSERPFFRGERFDFCPILKNGPTSPTKSMEDKVNPSASVVLDIAACDGPVFFERVINKAFRSNQSDADCNSDTDDDCDINVVDTTQPPQSPGRLMGEYFKSAIASRVESQLTPIPTSGGGSRTYHCIYCNSTFKSHYCYQKHMRRHINPITVEDNRGNDTRDSSVTSDQDLSPSSEHESVTSKTNATKRPHESPSSSSYYDKLKPDQSKELSQMKVVSPSEENTPTSSKLRVLDLNVQYFPCKTCGSKFPSYYFVHKHRRLCHREEEDQRKDNQTPTPSESSSFCTLNSNKSDTETAKIRSNQEGSAATVKSQGTTYRNGERDGNNRETDSVETV